MTAHEKWTNLVPFYVSGALPDKDRRTLEAHLSACPICRADAALWNSVASEIGNARDLSVAPIGPLDRALATITSLPTNMPEFDPFQTKKPIPGRTRLLLAGELVKWQISILRKEIWPSVAAVTAIGIACAALTGVPGVFRMIAPLIAAASLAMICGPDNDPALELTSAAPISQGKILLARATLVFGYNLILAVIGGLFLGTVLPQETFLALILGWLGPMTFLSALALFLSLSFGTANSITAAYSVWFLRFLPAGSVQWLIQICDTPAMGKLAAAYRSFWEQPLLLLPLAAALTIAAMRLADHRGSDRRRFATEL